MLDLRPNGLTCLSLLKPALASPHHRPYHQALLPPLPHLLAGRGVRCVSLADPETAAGLCATANLTLLDSDTLLRATTQVPSPSQLAGGAAGGASTGEDEAAQRRLDTCVGWAASVAEVSLGGRAFVHLKGLRKRTHDAAHPAQKQTGCPSQLVLRAPTCAMAAEMAAATSRALVALGHFWSPVSGGGATGGMAVGGGGAWELILRDRLLANAAAEESTAYGLPSSTSSPAPSFSSSFACFSTVAARSALRVLAAALEAPPRQLVLSAFEAAADEERCEGTGRAASADEARGRHAWQVC